MFDVILILYRLQKRPGGVILDLTKKKKIVLIAVPVLAVFIAAIVLTTVYFCTQNEALDFVEIPVKFPTVVSTPFCPYVNFEAT